MKLSIKSTFNLNQKVKIPLLGLGTWQAENMEVEEAVYHALKVGYRHIDTAKIYGNELGIGRAIKKAMSDFKIKREDLFITTKLWNSDHHNPLNAFERSRICLDLDYIDLYLIHWPVSQRLRSWQIMQSLVKEKRCLAVGVSNFTIQHLQEIIKLGLPVPSINQVEFSPFLYQKDLLEFCQEKGIILEAYSPLTRGEKLNHPIIKRLAEKYSKTPAQIFLRWALQHEIVIIPKSTNPERIEENADIFDFSISQTDMNILNSLDEGYRTCWNPENL
ncbi:MAG: aldo/keto reductase [Nanoarchaeota archaeon]|nr:aldo/keto reductase [Nanoarchaeota archaeon]